MATVTESNGNNFPAYRYFKSTQRFGRPADAAPPLSFSVRDNFVTSWITKDISKRDWRAMIKSGANATTPLSAAEYKSVKTPGYVSVTATRIANDAYGFKPERTETAWLDLVTVHNCPTVHNLGSSLTEADSRAKTIFVRRANEQMQSFKGLQHLAEASESIRMLRNNTSDFSRQTRRYLTQVENDLKGYKRRQRQLPVRLRRLGNVLDNLNDIVRQRYLEYTYGISPLLGTTKDAAETLSRIHNYEDSKDFRMVSAVAHCTGPISITSSGFSAGTFLRGDCNVSLSSTASVVYRGVVSTALSDLDSVNKFLGLAPSDFLPTVWEWLPWSFVADYVTNISEIIDGASFARSRLRWVARTQVIETKKSLDNFVHNYLYATTAYPTIYSKIDAHSFSAPTYIWTYKTIERDTYSGDLIPDFTFNVPGGKQVLNTAFLLASLKKSRSFITNFLTK